MNVNRQFSRKNVRLIPWNWKLSNLATQDFQIRSGFAEYLGGKAACFPQEAKQEVLGADVPVAEAFGFLSRIGQNTLVLVAERDVDGG